MDSGQLQNTFKSLCKVMWDNNVTNPITYVTQISYLLFLKMLEEMDHEQRGGPQRQLPNSVRQVQGR
jgi:type I restriction enzyme M protein